MSARKAFLRSFKVLYNPWASGGSAPWTPNRALPLDPTGALKRTRGPHAVKTRAFCVLELTLRVRNYF